MISAINGGWATPSSAKRLISVSYCCDCLRWCDLKDTKHKNHVIYGYVQHLAVRINIYLRSLQKATCYARSSEPCRHQKAGIRTMIGKHVVRVWFGGWAPIYVCLEGFQFVLAWPTKSVPTHTPSMFLLACSPNQMSQVPKWHEQQIPSKKTNSRENASETNQWTTI